MASTEMPESSSKMAASASTSEKEKMKDIGRQRLAEFKKKKQEKRAGGRNKPSTNSLSDRDASINGSETDATNGGKNKELTTFSDSSNGLVRQLDDEHEKVKKVPSMHNLSIEAPHSRRSEEPRKTLDKAGTFSASMLLKSSSLFEVSHNKSDNGLLDVGEHGRSTHSLDLSRSKGLDKDEAESYPLAAENSSAMHRSAIAQTADGAIEAVSGGSLFNGKQYMLPGTVPDLSTRSSSHAVDIIPPPPAPRQQNDISHSKDAKIVNGNSRWSATEGAWPGSKFRVYSNSNGIKSSLPEDWQPSRPLNRLPFKPVEPSLADSRSVLTFKPITPSLSEAQSGSQDPFLSSYSRNSSVSNFLSEEQKAKNIVSSVKKVDEVQVKTKNDDFAALEQHIDDLTQEKYSLQRAVDAAKSLAESLSQQNSALTEDFNSQASIINQLQAELEKKKDEIAAQSVVVNRFMKERERVQQENNAAHERFQLVAAEVIGLEEKVLKLKSSELKLQRELESLKSDNDSYRVQLSALDKDRQSLRSMVEVLQEDKKLLQKKFMDDVSKSNVVRKETRHISTSTDDLVLDDKKDGAISLPIEIAASSDTQTSVNEVASSSTMVPFDYHLDLTVPHGVATLSSDDFGVINNIDTVITELFSEKGTLLETLRKESARATELQALNIELSKKLEVQTQRLELAVAQNMAQGDGGALNIPNEDDAQDNYYVDEGDEVVERVLGWIMRLFPGGSSTRRTSKLL